MTCVRRPQCLSFLLGIRRAPLLGQVLVCTQFSLLYAFRLFIRDVQFFSVVWYAIVSMFLILCCLIGTSVDFLSLYTRPLYASASMPSFLYARPLSALASVPSLLPPRYALASQPPPLASAACCCSTVFYLLLRLRTLEFISFFYDSDVFF
ncbi:uncharacterized protein EI90DRAFT_3055646 [Cantharellus anzutake]|uniref:uncharacterized protein n=1 Tax=Cantharellus anzutake TaxID=1750568 RepID=UPI0019077F6B|nr:uncharacterized protein EI90DRAFT_3055646 [Cantharellus anzutake]KAF8331855.1 hypothetical protein EI90DRAFT_3055646 [Cantharellus anzutake]